MEQKPLPTEIAKFDAICDEYERGIRNGEVRVDDDTESLEPWLEQVSPQLRLWLQDELIAMRKEFQPPAANSDTISESVERESWRAILQCETFRPLSREAKLALATGFESRDYEAGEMLIRGGQRATGLFLITSGQVQVVGANNQDRYEIDSDGAGSVVGEMSTLTGYPCSADVVAETPVQTLVLPIEKFESLREANPEIEIALSQLVSDRLGHRRRDALCGKTLGGFQLQQCLGTGAMGVVYEAIAPNNERVAVKMLRHRFIYSPGVISKFDQEAEFLSRLKHDNIAAMRHHFVAYRTRFIVLDLFDGSDLRQVIRQHGTLSEPTAKAILGQIASGLLYAHQQGVLHLDLKPANILLDRKGRVAITDFGLSRLMESDGCDRQLVGTPEYMPPEQFLMSNLGPHSDWYSLACIAYELVAGIRPFSSRKPNHHLDGQLNSTESIWPNNVASQEYRDHWRNALQPDLAHRRLDINTIATWSCPVPELMADSGPASTLSTATR